jgi:regulatory protein
VPAEREPIQPDPIEIAARALQHRDRSRRQLDERLARAGVDELERVAALETLERVGYVDDARYAGSRAAELADRGYGDDAIRHLLEQDGIPAAAAAAALDELDPERERAARLVARLGHGPKTASQLSRKGFGDDAVEAAAAEVGGTDA